MSYRGERCAALALTGHRLSREHQDPQATDVSLLPDCIGPSVERRELFPARTMGWTLRQHAHEGPEAADRTRQVVCPSGDRMAPLSRREALTHLGVRTLDGGRAGSRVRGR